MRRLKRTNHREAWRGLYEKKGDELQYYTANETETTKENVQRWNGLL